MTSRNRPFPNDKTATERRKGLTDKELKDLELAGGVEGGMEAGSAGPSKPQTESGGDRGGGEHAGGKSA